MIRKGVAIFLCLYCMLVIVQPIHIFFPDIIPEVCCMNGEPVCKDTHEHKTGEHQHNHEKEGCDNTGCNPFQSCRCFAGFIYDSYDITFHAIETKRSEYPYPIISFHGNCLFDFWNPPKSC